MSLIMSDNKTSKADVDKQTKTTRRNVFMKPDAKMKNSVIEIEHVMQTVPKTHYITPQEGLANLHTEWRWKFLDINGRTYVEISRKDKNHERLYINKNKDWVKQSGLEKYNKFITKTLYAYLDQ